MNVLGAGFLALLKTFENEFLSDRKKDLVKLRNGEYIALGNIESCLKTSPLCDNLCIFADQNEIACVAVAVVNAQKIQELAKSLRLGKGRNYFSVQFCVKVVDF